MQETNTPDLIRFAKSRAKKLREYLAGQGHTLSHSQSLEATAKTEGFKDWNTYTAHFKLAEQAIPIPVHNEAGTTAKEPSYPLQVGDVISGTYRDCPFTGKLLGLEKTITSGVWRAKMHFDKPVKLPGHPALKNTRQRVNCMLNANGLSVDLKGKPDGHTNLNMP